MASPDLSRPVGIKYLNGGDGDGVGSNPTGHIVRGFIYLKDKLNAKGIT